MATYTHDNRPMSIDTPLGRDVLLLAGIQGVEAVSRLFSFELDLFSENSAIPFEDIIGKRVSISLELPDNTKRYLHGMISRFSQAAGSEAEGLLRFSRYRATLVPWTWLLTRTTDSRIFQNLSVPEIMEKIFQEKKFSDYSMEVQEQHDKREYCVQYRETDFNFISRLMEEEGIYYYFTHNKNTHTMVIADTPGKHKKIARKVRHFRSSEIPTDEDTISTLERLQEIQAGKYTLNDFNFEIPNTRLSASVDSQQKLGPGEWERYDYPGGYGAKALGERLARIRMEEEETRVTTLNGAGNCRDFASGFRFTLTTAYRSDISDKEYLITSVEHTAVQNWEGEAEASYRNSFTCIPFTVPFRPPLVTVKPYIHGSQTAVVVGKAGDEIYTDQYGRVKVQFHWDREGKRDENASCWMRVGQIWAGQGWGAVWIPRVGHEVIVSFLEGDPDRPLITGSVYDGTNMPPYRLPDEKTKSTIMSRTTPNAQTANELFMEDQTQKTRVVLSSAYGHKITQDEETQTLTIETRDKHMVTMDDKNKNIAVQTTNAHKLLFDDQNKKIVLSSTEGHTIEVDDQNRKMQAVTKDGHVMVFDDQNKKVSVTTTGGNTLQLDDDKKKIGATSAKGHFLAIDDSGGSITLEDSSGKHTFKIDISGSKLIISTSSGAIDIMAPSGKVTMKAMEIAIESSSDLTMKGAMNVTSEAGVQHTTKGAMVNAEASGVNTIKGTLVQIN
ncbi:MAG TPA: type VI secretion system tip protein TssI/VgrG [Deltaproteobacteria bacterium]|nr:type VI secretion system tip protein TssI/VgrG [Deltaproteobacteria bacterium]